MIISRTPFRVSFFGGGTDFPEFYREHGGAVLATTIDRYCYLTVHHLAPFFPHRFRASYAKTETVQRPAEFEHPLIRECLGHLGLDEGLEITHVADLPGRTGLGSSSSFTVGFLAALHAYRGEKADAEQLAREAIEVERVRVGDPGGHQDQYVAAYGGLARYRFTAEGVSTEPITLSPARRGALESNLLLFYTGLENTAGAILAEQRGRVKKNEAALLQMREMVDEGFTLLTGNEDLSAFGRLLDRAWQRKRELASGITNSLVDEAYEAALAAGAAGGKLLGAGGRGFLLLYVEPSHQEPVREVLHALREVTFAFSPHGSQVIFESSP